MGAASESPLWRCSTAIRRRIECALIIPMIIQTTDLHPSGSDQMDAAANVSRHDPTSAVQFDAKHLARNRKVVGSNPTSGSKPQVRAGYGDPVARLACLVDHPLCANLVSGSRPASLRRSPSG
jgi:hypothetical protein